MTYRACILLATYNGASWINEQIRSVTCQVGVRVSIVASDDYSDDGTCQILKHWAAQTDLLVLPHASKRFGNANRNFLHLICNAPFNNSDFFAFADQDDIWLPNKVERAIECLVTKGADAYSSDVIAFWPDGRHVPIIRSAPQRQYDYLFESAGPGCTFVLTRAAFEKLREWVKENLDILQTVKVHDWLIYAYARHQGWRWHIDQQQNMLYRQHDSNEVGANVGWHAALARFKAIRGGAFRNDVLGIAQVVGVDNPIVQALKLFDWRNRIYLMIHAGQCRRRLLDRWLLGIFFAFMGRK